jgi:hypothetical protein
MGMTPTDMAWRITLNPERISSLWWDAAKTRIDAPAALQPMLAPFAAEELLVSAADGAAILAWAATLPGWDEGRPPLIIERRG